MRRVEGGGLGEKNEEMRGARRENEEKKETMSRRIREDEEEEEERKGSGEEVSLGQGKKEDVEEVQQRLALAVGDTLQVGEDVLDLQQAFPEAGHGQD